VHEPTFLKTHQVTSNARRRCAKEHSQIFDGSLSVAQELTQNLLGTFISLDGHGRL
jgi:hypothetical protein